MDKKQTQETETIVKKIIMNREGLVGKTLEELNLRNKPGVTITRIKRSGIEFLPKSKMTLDKGDVCTAVGTEKAIMEFEGLFGGAIITLFPMFISLLSSENAVTEIKYHLLFF